MADWSGKVYGLMPNGEIIFFKCPEGFYEERAKLTFEEETELFKDME